MNERRLPLIHTTSGVLLMLAALSHVGCTKRLGPPEDQNRPPTAATEFGEMILVPAGEFAMGSNRGKDDERPVHNVWVDSFWIDKYEVTQGCFGRLMGKDPSHFKGAENPGGASPLGRRRLVLQSSISR